MISSRRLADGEGLLLGDDGSLEDSLVVVANDSSEYGDDDADDDLWTTQQQLPLTLLEMPCLLAIKITE
jgi:hypothetical protein